MERLPSPAPSPDSQLSVIAPDAIVDSPWSGMLGNSLTSSLFSSSSDCGRLPVCQKVKSRVVIFVSIPVYVEAVDSQNPRPGHGKVTNALSLGNGFWLDSSCRYSTRHSSDLVIWKLNPAVISQSVCGSPGRKPSLSLKTSPRRPS